MGSTTAWPAPAWWASTSAFYNKKSLLRAGRVLIPLFLVLHVLTRSGLIPPQIPKPWTSLSSTAIDTTPDAAEWLVAGQVEQGQNIKPVLSRLPRKIWQILFKPPGTTSTGPIDNKLLADTVSWLAWNPDYQYVLAGDHTAETFARKFSHRHPALPDMMAGLQNMGMKSDLLRYLILSVEGGVYSDIDTEPLKPINDWVPRRYRDDAAVVVGIEFDRLGGPSLGFPRNISFSQWTIATVPGHELFGSLVDSVVSKIQALAKVQDQPYSNLSISTQDVLESTGPSIWTDSVFDYLERQEPGLAENDLSGLREPRLVGDVLILPIDGVAMGLPHSGSTADGSIPDAAIVKHKFHGSWRGQGA